MNDIREFVVSDTDELVRLDKYLASQMPEFSRSEIQRFTVRRADGTAPKFSEKIRMGDAFRVEIPTPKTDVATDNVSSDFELDILFEDDDIIVINKPRGVVMYPSAGNKTGTLVQNILAHTNLSALGGATRPGVVHRLDKDTSGVMVFAKSDAAFRELVKTFSEHNLTRKYIAFVWGVPNWEVADITGNIARSSRNRQKMTMVKTGGKPSHTEVAVINAWSRAKISEMRCTLFTGICLRTGFRYCATRSMAAVHRAWGRCVMQIYWNFCARTTARCYMPKCWNSRTRQPANRCGLKRACQTI